MSLANKRKTRLFFITAWGIFLFTFSCFFALSAKAKVFDVHLLYNEEDDQLTLNPDASPAVSVSDDEDISIMGFLQNHSEGEFEVVFIYIDGYDGVRARFSPEKGYFVFRAPYLSLAREIKVYKIGISEPLFSYDLENLSTCNKNGICEFEKKENVSTCIPDCVGTVVNFSDETKKLLKQSNDVIKDPKSGEVLLRGIQPVSTTQGGGTTKTIDESNVIVLIISGVVLFLVGIGAWMFVKLRKRNKQYGL